MTSITSMEGSFIGEHALSPNYRDTKGGEVACPIAEKEVGVQKGRSVKRSSNRGEGNLKKTWKKESGSMRSIARKGEGRTARNSVCLLKKKGRQ